MDNKAGGEQCVHCREVVRCSECPLSEVPLYTAHITLCITMMLHKFIPEFPPPQLPPPPPGEGGSILPD